MTSTWEISDEEFIDILAADLDAEDIADYSGYNGGDFHSEVYAVAEKIYNIHAEREVTGRFLFDFTCDTDGAINGGVVSMDVPKTGFYVTAHLEWKHLTHDREATGTAAVLGIKNALLTTYGTIHEFATTKGLI